MKAVLNGRRLTIELDLAEKPELSKTGKTLIMGTSAGFKEVKDSGGIKFSLNVTAPLEGE